MKHQRIAKQLLFGGFALIMLLLSLNAAQPNELLRRVQERLTDEGFRPGTADGLMGPKTKAALRLYQQKQNLPVTGSLDTATIRSFYSFEKELVYKNYSFRIYRDKYSGGQTFDIWQNEHPVYSQLMDLKEYGLFEISDAHYENKGEIKQIKVGQDITGDGQPNLIIRQWTGGAHCCIIYHIFQIGNVFRSFGTINIGHGEPANFNNIDKDPNLELVVTDLIFGSWRTSSAESYAPIVVLRFSNGAFSLAQDLMCKPPPEYSDIVDLSQSAQEFLKQRLIKSPGLKQQLPEFDIGVYSLWEFMIEFIYSGHTELAWEFFEMVWPISMAGKKEILAEFRSLLQSSKYWLDIQAMNSTHIKQVQTNLKNLGLYDGSNDGIWGSETKSALKQFQKAKGLQVTGILDGKTEKALSIKYGP